MRLGKASVAMLLTLGLLAGLSAPAVSGSPLPGLPQISAQFFSPSYYNSNVSAMNAALGVAGDVIADLSALSLPSGLSITQSGGPYFPNPMTWSSLPTVNDDAANCAQTWSWLSTGYYVVNTTGNSLSNCTSPLGTSNTLTFNLPAGTIQFGIGLANFQSPNAPNTIANHELLISVDGVHVVDVGTIESLAGANWTPGTVRNAYMVLTATSGSISSVGFQTDNNALDDVGFSDLAIAQAPSILSTDGPIPLWALVALGAGLAGIASRRLKKA
jgi:hypothetical protein